MSADLLTEMPVETVADPDLVMEAAGGGSLNLFGTFALFGASDHSARP